MNSIPKMFYYQHFVPAVQSIATSLVDNFIHECRLKIIDTSDVKLIVDGGWTHPGWWANECCVYAIDADTSLPIAREYVIRGENFSGTSKAMEGWAAEKIANTLKNLGYNVSCLIHDKDSSSKKSFQTLFPNIEEYFCTCRCFISFFSPI
jgi:hypothetical protein